MNDEHILIAKKLKSEKTLKSFRKGILLYSLRYRTERQLTFFVRHKISKIFFVKIAGSY
jgi:hypothetical protein